jgi:uncharacterized membrane protein
MGKGRLEAFSDGVIAIIITIMVLELRAPAGEALRDLRPLLPTFLSYILSFIYVGIYWNNHHHLLRLARSITGPVMWANMHQLFWLSTVPFVTAWMGEHSHAAGPVALYGGVLLMNALAYTLLMTLLVRNEGADSPLARAMGRDIKGKVSVLIYLAGIVLAALGQTGLALGAYVLVACIWFIPDRRVERVVEAQDPGLE